MDKKTIEDIFKRIEENKKNIVHDINSKVLLVDGLNTFIRSFSVSPSMNDNGDHIGGITGFLKSIGSAIKKFHPSRCIVIFDGKGGSKKRKEIYPEYKKRAHNKLRYNRVVNFLSEGEEEESMKKQFSRLIEYLSYLPISIIVIDNIEADDTISYITTTLLKNECVIMSTDKDFYQLITDKIHIWSPTMKKLYTPEALYEEYGIYPYNFILYKIIEGDKSDNIGKVKQIGLETARKIIPKIFETEKIKYNEFIEYINELDSKLTSVKNLKESKDILDRNYKLMQLSDVDISANAKSNIRELYNAPIKKMNVLKLKILFMQDKLYSDIVNFNSWIDITFNYMNTFAK